MSDAMVACTLNEPCESAATEAILSLSENSIVVAPALELVMESGPKLADAVSPFDLISTEHVL